MHQHKQRTLSVSTPEGGALEIPIAPEASALARDLDLLDLALYGIKQKTNKDIAQAIILLESVLQTDLISSFATPANKHLAAARIGQWLGHEAKQFALERFKTFAPAPEPEKQTLNIFDGAKLIDEYPTEPEQIISGICDCGDKLCIIGPSKCRKSYFALQLALCLATGAEFLGMEIQKPRRVLLVQNEINHPHFHRRLRDMAITLGITSHDVGENLTYINMRGAPLTIDEICDCAIQNQSEMIILDPVYKMLTGEENAAEDWRPLLASFDRLARTTNATICYIHHDKKGAPGASQLSDRGAGSGILARDYDAAMFLAEHETQPDHYVLDFLLRNYPAKDAVTLSWAEGKFNQETKIAPQIATKFNGNIKKQTTEQLVDAALSELSTEPIDLTTLRSTLRNQLGIPFHRACEVLEAIKKDDRIFLTRNKLDHRKQEISLKIDLQSNFLQNPQSINHNHRKDLD